MTDDRVYPTAKPTANGTTAGPTANGGANPTIPANKAQRRPMYRPRPPPRRRGRSCCCCCCLWTTFIIIIIILLAAIGGAVFWVLYRPQRPNFSVSNLQLSQFNLTTTNVISKFNLTITAHNPNEKLTFFYDPITISTSSNDVNIAEGSFQGFMHGTKNTTVLRTVVSSSSQPMEGSDISTLRTALKNKKNLPLKMELNTKVKVKVGSLKTKKLSIRVTCDGVQVAVPTGKLATTATTSGAKCKVDPRIKILNWTF